MRIPVTQLDQLPVRLLVTAGVVRIRQRISGVVIESRERAPGPALILVCLLAAPGYFTSERGSGTQTCQRGYADRNREQ